MGKVSPKERKSKITKQKRWIRNSSNTDLRLGAIAQLQNNKASGAKLCTGLGNKRVDGLEVFEKDNVGVIQSNGFHGSPLMMSPERFALSPVSGLASMGNNVLRTPKTPVSGGFRF